MHIGRPRSAAAIAGIFILVGIGSLVWHDLPWSPLSATATAAAVHRLHPTGRFRCTSTARYGHAPFGRRYYTCAWLAPSGRPAIGIEVDHSHVVDVVH